MSRPSSSTRPASGRCRPAIVRSSVLLPLPLGPEHGHALAVGYVEVDAGERVEAVERDREALDAKSAHSTPRRTAIRSASRTEAAVTTISTTLRAAA